MELLDRVICVDRGAPVPIGRKGTIVGIQTPHLEVQTAEEAFKSTGVTTLLTVIVLCDPVPDIFEKPIPEIEEPTSTDKLTASLASILNINGDKEETVATKQTTDPIIPLKPKLVKFYPYQLINLTYGPVDRSRPKVESSSAISNRVDGPSWPPKPKNLSNTGPIKNGDVKILKTDKPAENNLASISPAAPPQNSGANIVDLMSLNVQPIKPNAFIPPLFQGPIKVLRRSEAPTNVKSGNLSLKDINSGRHKVDPKDINTLRSIAGKTAVVQEKNVSGVGDGDAGGSKSAAVMSSPLSKMLFEAQRRHDVSGSIPVSNTKVQNQQVSPPSKVQNQTAKKNTNVLVNTLTKSSNVTTSISDTTTATSNVAAAAVKPKYNQVLKQSNIRPATTVSNRNVALSTAADFAKMCSDKVTTQSSTTAANLKQKKTNDSSSTTASAIAGGSSCSIKPVAVNDIHNSLQSLLSSSVRANAPTTIAMQNELMSQLTTAQSKIIPPATSNAPVRNKIPAKLHNQIFAKATNTIRAQVQAQPVRPTVLDESNSSVNAADPGACNALLQLLQNPGMAGNASAMIRPGPVMWTGHGQGPKVIQAEKQLSSPNNPSMTSMWQHQPPGSSVGPQQSMAGMNRVIKPPSPPMYWVRHGETVAFNPQQHNVPPAVPMPAFYSGSGGPILQPTPQGRFRYPMTQQCQPMFQQIPQHQQIAFQPVQQQPIMFPSGGPGQVYYDGFQPQYPHYPAPMMYPHHPSQPGQVPHAFVPLQVDRARAFTTTGHPYTPPRGQPLQQQETYSVMHGDHQRLPEVESDSRK